MSQTIYRTQPNTLTEAEVKELNRGRTPDRRLPTYKQAREKLKERNPFGRPFRKMGTEELQLWLTHPDERFQIDLAREAVSHREQGFWVADQLLEQARREQRRKGHFWTPLMDAMADNGYSGWPRAYRYQEYTDSEEVPEYFISRDDQLENFEQVLAARTVDREFLDLLDFQYSPIHHLLARHFEHPTPGFLKELQEKAPHTLPSLAQNPRLSTTQHKRLARQALETLQEAAPHGQVSYTTRNRAQNILSRLAEEGVELPTTVVEELGDLLAERSHTNTVLSILKALDDQLSSQQLEDLYERVKGSSAGIYTVKKLLRHSAVSQDLVIRVLQETSGQDLFKLRKFIMREHQDWLDNKGIRGVVLDTNSAPLLTTALEEANTPKRYKEAFYYLLSADFEEAVRLATRPKQRKRKNGETPDWLLEIGDDLCQMCRKRVLRKQSSHSIQYYFKHVSDAREDMEIRMAFLERAHKTRKAILNLCQDARGEEMKQLFGRLRQEYPRSAIKLLKEGEMPGRQDLSQEDFLPLLQHDNSQIRQEALLAVKDFSSPARSSSPLSTLTR